MYLVGNGRWVPLYHMISTYSVPRVEYIETDYYIVLPALEQNYGGAFAVRG